MVDMRLYFRDHRVFRAERELQADSSPDFRADYWEFYDTRGNVVRIGWDYDHDGRADRWDRIDRSPRSAPPGQRAAAARSPRPADGRARDGRSRTRGDPARSRRHAPAPPPPAAPSSE
jgi:hypothetical protein